MPERSPRRAVRDAAREIRRHGRRQIRHETSRPQYADVITVSPTTVAEGRVLGNPQITARVELGTEELVLEPDDIVLDQTVRTYDKQFQIDPDDNLFVTPMANGDWLATGVISDKELDAP
jgi:hypothetical protein